MPVVKNIDKKAILSKVKDNTEIGIFAAQSLQKHVSPYIPYNTGRLCNDVSFRPYEIHYNAPYARKVYNDMKRNFRKDKHPLATARWIEVAMPAVKKYWVQDIQNFIDGMDLND